MRVFFAAWIAMAVALSCVAQSPHAQPAEALPKLPSVNVTLVDSSVSPCENFYQYTCDKLNAANPIPPDELSWGSFNKLAEWNRIVLRQILEKNEAAGGARTPNEQKIGDFAIRWRS